MKTRSPLSLIIVLSVLPLVLGIGACSEQKDSNREVVTGNAASADGVNIAYEVRGQGDPALVFVHCWCCDKNYWSNQIEEFSKNYKVVTIDLAGHGNSGMGRQKYTLEAFGDDVVAVADKEKLNSMVLIGHSMGGSVIVKAAGKLAQRVKALVGVDCYNDLGQTFTKEQLEAFIAPFRNDFEGTTRTFVGGMFAPQADSSLIARIVDDMASGPAAVGVGAFENLFDYLFTGQIIDDIRTLQLPVYSINSDQQPTNIEIWKDLVPTHDVKIIEGAGHFVQLEKPVEFNAALMGIVAGLRE